MVGRCVDAVPTVPPGASSLKCASVFLIAFKPWSSWRYITTELLSYTVSGVASAKKVCGGTPRSLLFAFCSQLRSFQYRELFTTSVLHGGRERVSLEDCDLLTSSFGCRNFSFVRQLTAFQHLHAVGLRHSHSCSTGYLSQSYIPPTGSKHPVYLPVFRTYLPYPDHFLSAAPLPFGRAKAFFR